MIPKARPGRALKHTGLGGFAALAPHHFIYTNPLKSGQGHFLTQ